MAWCWQHFARKSCSPSSHQEFNACEGRCGRDSPRGKWTGSSKITDRSLSLSLSLSLSPLSYLYLYFTNLHSVYNMLLLCFEFYILIMWFIHINQKNNASKQTSNHDHSTFHFQSILIPNSWWSKQASNGSCRALSIDSHSESWSILKALTRLFFPALWTAGSNDGGTPRRRALWISFNFPYCFCESWTIPLWYQIHGALHFLIRCI